MHFVLTEIKEGVLEGCGVVNERTYQGDIGQRVRVSRRQGAAVPFAAVNSRWEGEEPVPADVVRGLMELP